jgi:uncharacterized Fe-S cluster protein YjdI
MLYYFTFLQAVNPSFFFHHLLSIFKIKRNTGQVLTSHLNLVIQSISNMKDITKKYTNGEVTIVWKPSVCIHSTLCWKGANALPEVFNPQQSPWITPEGASTERIIQQVNQCPSGALSFYMNNEADANKETIAESIVEVTPKGPLLVYGNITVKDKDGNTTKKNKVTAFCRCGGSGNKPYCDGSHTRNGFEG